MVDGRMISVLIIEDSYYLGIKLQRMIDSELGMRVVHRSDLAEDALDKIGLLEPDVIILDIEMPGIPSLDILYKIMRENPTPTIVLGTESEMSRREIVNAFSYGAFNFIIRPQKNIEIDKIRDDLVTLVKVAASVEIKDIVVRKPSKAPPKVSEKIVIIGASCGGVTTIRALLTTFPADFPAAVVVVQHMPASFTGIFAETLDGICPLHVEEAEEGSRVESGKVLVAPGGYNMEFTQKGKHLFTRLNKKHTIVKPSIDLAMKSLGKICGGNVIAVILTGMGEDGSEGVKWVRKNGGKVIVQDKSSSLIYGMPKAVIQKGDADFILPLSKITEKLVEIL